LTLSAERSERSERRISFPTAADSALGAQGGGGGGGLADSGGGMWSKLFFEAASQR